MVLLGTIVNAGTIILGSIIGLLLTRFPGKMKTTIMQGLGLAVLVIGGSMAFKAGDDILWVILSMVLGSVLGEWMGIDDKLDRVGQFAEKKMRRFGNGKVAEAFVFATLVYCIGAMSIVGALQSGLENNHTTLYTKSLLDGFSAIIFTSTMGIGVILSAIPVFLYQGAIALSAGWLSSILQEPVITIMTAAGGLLIMGIGFNVLEIKKINVANMLPAIFIAGILKWVIIRFF